MKYVFSGATSATGNSVARHLAAKVGAQNITCLVRPTSEVAPLQKLGLRLETGDVTDTVFLRRVLNRDTIYLDMTHPKFYPQSIDAIRDSGVKRAYFVTTTGVFSKYHHCSDIYQEGEARIRDSGINYTILRPSMIYGSSRDKNMNKLISFLHRAPAFPLFGAGRSLMQPVFIEDLGSGITGAIDNPATEYQEYNLAGPRGLTYRAIVGNLMDHLGRRVPLLNIGLPLAAAIVKPAQYIPGFPIREEQVLRLLEDKVFDISKARAELNYNPRSFDKGIAIEVEEMKAAGLLN